MGGEKARGIAVGNNTRNKGAVVEVISRDGKAKIRARAGNRERLRESVSEGTGANVEEQDGDKIGFSRNGGAMLSAL